MKIESFRKASELQKSIKRHKDALFSLEHYEKTISDPSDPFNYNRFPIIEETYPCEVAVPIIQSLKAWHLESIAKHEKEFSEL